MKKVCGWCGKPIGEVPGSVDMVTHGICPDCLPEVFRQVDELIARIEKEKKDEILGKDTDSDKDRKDSVQKDV